MFASTVWEQGVNRLSQAKKGNNKRQNDAKPVWFNHAPESLYETTPLTLKIRLDLSDFYISLQELDEIRFMSDLEQVGFDVQSGQGLVLQADENKPGVFYADLAMESYRRDVAFKWVFMHQEELYWEKLPGHANHTILIEQGRSEAVLALQYSKELGRFIPDVASCSGVTYSPFAELAQEYGQAYANSEHSYQQLLFDFMNNRQSTAWQNYLQWKQLNAQRDIDDMTMMYADYLAETSSVDQAMSLLSAQQEHQPNLFRKNQLEYHKAELLHRHGFIEEAKQRYRF